MKSDTLEEIQDISEKLLRINRLSGHEGNSKVKKALKEILRSKGIPYTEERFYVEKFIPMRAILEVQGKRIKGIPYIGSPSGVYEGYLKRDPLEGDIALFGVSHEIEGIRRAKEKGAKACITYMETLNTHYYGAIEDVSIPVVNIKEKDLDGLEDAYIKVYVESQKKKLECSNIIFELGRGPIVYIVDNIDTRHEVFGSIENGIGSLLLIFVADELKHTYKTPYRLRFLITDAKELGLEGSSFHVKRGIKHTYYCINLNSVGWYYPEVIYRDAEGYNSDRMMSMFLKHAEDIKMSVSFKACEEAKGDHMPFKRTGVQTLFISSSPFNLRHTFHDNLDAVNWDMFCAWYELILSFLRRFHRL
ncbi:MAG: M28 family peptidase [Aquificaceae bacterium]